MDKEVTVSLPEAPLQSMLVPRHSSHGQNY